MYNIIEKRKQGNEDNFSYKIRPIKEILPPSLEETLTTELIDWPKKRK